MNIADGSSIPIETAPDGALRVQLPAQPGLYQLSVVADASGFDWNELYFELHGYGNEGVLSGPWDFDLRNGNVPLIPSYRMSCNGKYIGMWFFQRVSIEDIEARRFRGRAAFWIEAQDLNAACKIQLEFMPYRSMKIVWQDVRWEHDPEDSLEPALAREVARAHLPADDWNDPHYWQHLREALAGTRRLFEPSLARGFEWVQGKESQRYDDIPLLIAGWRLGYLPDGLASALRIIDETVALPHWGNPNVDGYSHDGDMGAANALWTLSWSLHALRDELGAQRTHAVRDKLQLQTGRFLRLALLNRDYWGGSVLQDHGWRSHFAFGTAVLHLLGELPDSKKWLGYVLPRLRRAVDAMPRDGVIPQSSYGSLFLHLDALAHYRDALLLMSGEDLYDQAPFHPVVDYVLKSVREREHTMILPNYNGGTLVPFIGGNLFLHQMAAKFSDGRAAHLQQLLLETPPAKFHHSTQEFAYYNGALWGFLSYSPGYAAQAVAQPASAPAFTHFQDSGLVHYHDAGTDLTLTLRCGPWISWHAGKAATGPCDAMAGAPGAGHFVLALGNTPLLVTPDAGYSLTSALCTCLLVDGKGQYGDIGYPMSIPSWKHRGEGIGHAHWDTHSGEGHVRLNLAPAYAETSGVVSYTREFIFRPGTVVCRDTVQLNRPRTLSWLFQGQRDRGMVLRHGHEAVFGDALTLLPRTTAFLSASIQPTPVVYSYSSASGYAKFDHVRYDTTIPVEYVEIDFELMPL